jgi:cell division protein FtsN
MNRILLQGMVIKNFLQGEAGKIHRGVLLAILLIFAVGGYVYYFTDLIGPVDENGRETSNGSLVKKPMPQRPVATAGVQEEKPATRQQVIAGVPGQNAAIRPAIPVNPPIGHNTGSSPQTGNKQYTDTSPSAKTAKAAGKNHFQSSVHPSPDKGTPENEEKGRVKLPEQPIPEIPAVLASKSTSKPSSGTYTLQIGVYVTSKAMLAEKTKLKTAGLNPVVTKGPSKLEPMNRLFIGEFDNYAEAALQMQKLRKATQGAFILPEKGKYVLYAGSYFVKQSAEKERNRLLEAGFKPEVRKRSLPVSTMKLTVGNFQSRKSAEQVADHLKNLGIKASIVPLGT